MQIHFSPADAVPDVIPVMGWLEDSGVVAGVIDIIRIHIRPEHRQQVRQAMGSQV